jgi:hypothetical protein
MTVPEAWVDPPTAGSVTLVCFATMPPLTVLVGLRSLISTAGAAFLVLFGVLMAFALVWVLVKKTYGWREAQFMVNKLKPENSVINDRPYFLDISLKG